MLNEEFLHYIWKNQKYYLSKMQTVAGQTIEIIHEGYAHQDAGPDFKQAIIKIDGIIWIGNVEIHVKSSDWLRHGHQSDLKYQTVILHIVYENDMDIKRNNNEFFPALELKNYIPQKIINEYDKLLFNINELPCQSQLHLLNPLQIASFLMRLNIERLSRKKQNILLVLKACQGDWEECFFRILAISFGFKTNASSFELLAKSLPYKYLQKHLAVRLQVYALIFGQAGLLDEDLNDEYYQLLHIEYQYLKYKYRLIPIHPSSWNYLRLRPKNFPCIRLAQLSELLYQTPLLFKQLLEGCYAEQLIRLMLCQPDSYWELHSKFGRPAKMGDISLKKESIELLVINTLVPILYAYAEFHGSESLQLQAIEILEQLSFEENYITRQYRAWGFPSKGAVFSQGILELKQHYCLRQACINCDIGKGILRHSFRQDKINRQ
jgi:hypothetical protein